MENQVTNNANALRLFFQEDVFLVQDDSVKIPQLETLKPVYDEVERIGDPIKKQDSAASNQADSIQIPAMAPETSAGSPKIDAMPEKPVEARTFKYLGGNQKSVLILVNDSSYDVSTEQGRELLRKIVKAIELSTPDFALLNYANHIGASFSELRTFFKPRILLSFGVATTDLSLNFIWQNEIIHHEEIRMIFAPNLHVLDADLAGKKLLWGNLKKL